MSACGTNSPQHRKPIKAEGSQGPIRESFKNITMRREKHFPTKDQNTELVHNTIRRGKLRPNKTVKNTEIVHNTIRRGKLRPNETARNTESYIQTMIQRRVN